MSFTNPTYFYLSVFIAFVILLYFFRKQYTAVANPSNLLWQQVMNEWSASPFLKKLQQNLLFWLQIAALALCILALAGPHFFSSGLKGKRQIWIVDTSASMSAMVNGKSILDQTKEEMLKMADRLNGQDVTLITASEKPATLLYRETNQAVLKKTIHQLSVTYDHENTRKALQLAESFAANNETAIHVFSDGARKSDFAGLTKAEYISVHNAGASFNNLALLSFGVRERDSKVSGLAVVENQGGTRETFPLLVKSENEILFQKEITVQANERAVVEIPSLPNRRFYQAVIKINDHYTADNDMTAVYTNMKQDVYGVGDINPFIIKGLQILGIQTTRLTSQESETGISDGIVVAEGIPVKQLPKRPLLYINKGRNQFELKDPINGNDSPLTDYVDIEKTYIKSAAAPLAGNWETIAASGSHPLIQTGNINGQPAVILNFSVENTDWPLHPGFPIFLNNCYQWLSRKTEFLGYFQPGEEKWLQFDHKEDRMEIYSQSGKSLNTLELSKENFKAPYKPGVYQAICGGQVYYFSVQLDDREKKTSHGQSFSINEDKAAPNSNAQVMDESIIFWLVLALTVLLMAEWEVFRRGFRA